MSAGGGPLALLVAGGALAAAPLAGDVAGDGDGDGDGDGVGALDAGFVALVAAGAAAAAGVCFAVGVLGVAGALGAEGALDEGAPGEAALDPVLSSASDARASAVSPRARATP